MTPRRTLPLLIAALFTSVAVAAEKQIRVGMIGLDTSHATAFTKLLNDPKHPDHIPGAKIVAAVPAVSRDIESSYARIDRFVAELKKDPTIVFYNTIAEMLPHVDAVMIEAVDGRPHLAQAREVFKAKKPLFIDKPIAGSLRDTLEIFRLAKESGTPCFSSSSLRQNTRAALQPDAHGDVLGAFTFGPASLEPHHPDMFWYGIHAIEALFTVMGTGCKTVTRTHTANTDVITGVWADGRVGTMRGNRGGRSSYGVTVFGAKATTSLEVKSGYRALV